MKLRSAWLLTIATIASFPCNAQNINTIGIFPTIDHSGQLSTRWSYYAYLFSAINLNSQENRINEMYSSRVLYAYLETGITYKMNKQVYLTASYVHEQQNLLPNTRQENRLFQQITWKLPVNKFELKQRLRFDERFIQDPVTKETPFTSRVRYLVGLSSSISDRWYWFGYSEFFFNTSKNTDFKFSENWTALQLGYKLNTIHSLEFGLLYIGWIYNNDNNWLNQYYLQTTWVSRINLQK